MVGCKGKTLGSIVLGRVAHWNLLLYLSIVGCGFKVGLPFSYPLEEGELECGVEQGVWHWIQGDTGEWNAGWFGYIVGTTQNRKT